MVTDKSTVPYRWLLTRAHDDGNLVGIELDDFQVSFLPERLSLSINITSQQRDMIAAWWTALAPAMERRTTDHADLVERRREMGRES